MQNATSLGRLLFLGSALIGSLACLPSTAHAKVHRLPAAHHGAAKAELAGDSRSGHRNAKYVFAKGSKMRYAHAGYGGLQCVPFARAASGIELKGNAANWWDAAAGVYERGSAPEAGSVLNFRATGGMRLGHVAVVTDVLDNRHIQIEHANWSKGSISRNVVVEDLSPANDWTAVRVGSGTGAYPTYGFIYDRPDTGTMLASAHAGTGDIGGGDFAAAAELRPAAYREVAMVPMGRRYHRTSVLIARHASTGHRHRLILEIADHTFQ